MGGNTGSFSAATDGLRNITGQVNTDGTVAIYAVSSTISAGGDQGADPDKLFEVTDLLSATVLPVTESFNTIESSGCGQVIRGVAFAPVDATVVPEPVSVAISSLSLAGLAWLRRRR